jgi:hypothetical protein
MNSSSFSTVNPANGEQIETFRSILQGCKWRKIVSTIRKTHSWAFRVVSVCETEDHTIDGRIAVQKAACGVSAVLPGLFSTCRVWLKEHLELEGARARNQRPDRHINA